MVKYFNLYTVLTFLILISFSKIAFSDDWVVEKFNDKIIVSKNGEITHGDNLRFFIAKDYCDEVQETFTFYTTSNHININDLAGKMLNVKMNDYETQSEVKFIFPFLLGHIVWFDMGRYKINDHIDFFKNITFYELRILNTESFFAEDYFDIRNNHWNIAELKKNLEKGREECKNL